jgi:DNA-binding response OmpR family regulator
MKKILIIEDDPAISRGLVDALKEENFQTMDVENGEKGYQLAKDENYDLIILDLMLPGKNGMDVCKDLRSENVNTPIIMLTSKKEELDKVLGLELGADDYVTKPFSLRELLARIKAILRRESEIVSNIEEYSFGDVYINFITSSFQIWSINYLNTFAKGKILLYKDPLYWMKFGDMKIILLHVRWIILFLLLEKKLKMNLHIRYTC